MSEEVKEYPRFVRVHESRVMREQRKPNADFALVDYGIAAKEHVTAGPMFPKFDARKDGSVWAYVNNEKEEKLATSPKEEPKEEKHAPPAAHAPPERKEPPVKEPEHKGPMSANAGQAGIQGIPNVGQSAGHKEPPAPIKK